MDTLRLAGRADAGEQAVCSAFRGCVARLLPSQMYCRSPLSLLFLSRKISSLCTYSRTFCIVSAVRRLRTAAQKSHSLQEALADVDSAQYFDSSWSSKRRCLLTGFGRPSESVIVVRMCCAELHDYGENAISTPPLSVRREGGLILQATLLNEFARLQYCSFDKLAELKRTYEGRNSGQ